MYGDCSLSLVAGDGHNHIFEDGILGVRLNTDQHTSLCLQIHT